LLVERAIERLSLDPAWLADSYGGGAIRWLTALLIACLVFLLLWAVKRVVTIRLRDLIEGSVNVVDDLVLVVVRGTGWPFKLLAALFAGSLALDLPAGHDLVVHRLFTIVLFVQIGLWANRVLTFSVAHYLKGKTRQELGTKVAVVTLFNFFGHMLVWSLVGLLILDNLGVDVNALIAGLGVGGIAIGLALQSVLRDTFASLSIILDKPFEPGDFVVIDEFAGHIEEIGLKTTRIRSISGEQLVFGNDDLLTCRIRNFKRMAERRVLFRFGVAYETPTDLLASIGGLVQGIIEGIPGTRFDRAHFKEFGDHCLEFEVSYYVTVPDYKRMRDVHEAVNLALHRGFEEHRIRFAYPTRRVLVETAATPAGRATPLLGEPQPAAGEEAQPAG
jgi:small-conductance mechanosensitive channel